MRSLHYRVLNGAGDIAAAFGSAELAGPRAVSAASASSTSACMLGAQVLGAAQAEAPAVDFPVQMVRVPRLLSRFGSQGADHAAWTSELWLSNGECKQGQVGSIRFSCDGQLLFGTLQVHQANLAARHPADGVTPLQQASAAAYAELFALIEAQGYPHLWRIWNYLSDINAESDGLERYRQFNVGRHQAFEAYGRLHRETVPAACALGTRAPEVPLSIAFLAARENSLPLENPRQIAAYDYPPDYGPRSPRFARASLARLPGQAVLFISGTASIIGHTSMHDGDVIAQTRETLTNIDALLDEATREGARIGLDVGAWHPRDLSYRAYLRHAADLAPVQALLERQLGGAARIEFVQADICRAELLIEIEAVGLRPLP